MYFMVRSLLSNQYTISDHVGRGNRWGVARKASLSFEMGLLCIYPDIVTITRTQQTPPWPADLKTNLHASQLDKAARRPS